MNQPNPKWLATKQTFLIWMAASVLTATMFGIGWAIHKLYLTFEQYINPFGVLLSIIIAALLYATWMCFYQGEVERQKRKQSNSNVP